MSFNDFLMSACFDWYVPISKTKNEHFFKTWSSDMAYVLGFFAADGSMVKTKRGGHYIEFQITDGDLLEKIRDLFKSENEISVRQRNPRWDTIYRLQMGSKIMFEDLGRLGFVQDKTKVMVFPHVPSGFLGDFVRGYFDGDGNVWHGKIHTSDRPHASDALLVCFTSGSREFLVSLKDALAAFGGLLGGSLCHSRAFRLNYASGDALKLYRFMYYHSGGLCLGRKKRIFEDFLNMRA